MTGPVFESSTAEKSKARIEEDAPPFKPEPKHIGHPFHEPTEASRGAVTMLAAFRISQPRIAQALKISEPTLRKYYRHELDNAEIMVDAAVLTAWMKNVQAGKEMTILRYMETKYRLNDHDGIAAALPSVVVLDNIPRGDHAAVLETDVRDEGRSTVAGENHDQIDEAQG